MKCPYKNFQECELEKCPACNYKTIEYNDIEGNYPVWIGTDTAISQGYAWKVTKKKYEFISCSLVSGNVQPIPSNNETINNYINNETNVSVHRSVF